MKEKLHKYSFLGCLLLAGIVFFTWTDNWQVYTEPLQETYTKGVLLAEQLVEGKWPGISGEQSDATGSVSGNVPGENVKTGDTVSDGNQTDQTMSRYGRRGRNAGDHRNRDAGSRRDGSCGRDTAGSGLSHGG